MADHTSSPPSFDNLTADSVLAETDEILRTTEEIHDRLVATIIPGTASFANVIRPIVDDENRAACRLVILSDLLAQLSPDRDIRQAARQAEEKINAARVKKLMRHDVAALVLAVHAKESNISNLDPQDRHLLSYMHAKYVRSGAALQSHDERERLRQMATELSGLCAAAQDTLINPEEGLWFDRAELSGVPDHVLATMTHDDSRIQVTFSKNHVAAVLRYAASSDARQRLLVADRCRLPENVERLSRVVILRDEMARSLGFKNHAALKMESRMAPDVSYVRTHLEAMHQGLKPVAEAETIRLANCKKEDTSEDYVEVFDWDKAYYGNKLRQRDTTVNMSLLSEYFEVNHTAQAMLDVFCDLFGLRFDTMTTMTWHRDVTSYYVSDESGEFLGHLYMDLFAREGKYRGAHCVGLRPGFVEQDGTRHYPAAALVCSYARPSESNPSLLQHSEVTTMFHELGHAIHNLVSKTKYALGRSRDYSEIPSILLENWTWVPDMLVRVGKHFAAVSDEDPKDKGQLPRELAEAVCATRNSNRANAILGHIWPALFDLAIHTPPTHAAALQMDTTKV